MDGVRTSNPNVVVAMLVLTGLMSLMVFAGAAMALSSVSVVGNSLRLKFLQL